MGRKLLKELRLIKIIYEEVTYMKCPECGAKLNNYETFWDCPECGYFKEKTKYAKLEEQNERFLNKFLGDDDIP